MDRFKGIVIKVFFLGICGAVISGLRHGKGGLVDRIGLDKVVFEVIPVVVGGRGFRYEGCPINQGVAELVGDLDFGECFIQELVHGIGYSCKDRHHACCFELFEHALNRTAWVVGLHEKSLYFGFVGGSGFSVFVLEVGNDGSGRHVAGPAVGCSTTAFEVIGDGNVQGGDDGTVNVLFRVIHFGVGGPYGFFLLHYFSG